MPMARAFHERGDLMRRPTAITAGLVAAAMLLAITTGGTSAAKPDRGDSYPPFSNACAKAGGTVTPTVFGSQLTSLTCTKPNPPGLSADDVDRLTRACKPVGGIYSALDHPTPTLDAFNCVLVQLIPS